MSVHETEDNILRSTIAMLNKANIPIIIMDKPTMGTFTPGTSGSLATGTYTYRATALDVSGNESFISATSADQSVTGPNGSVAIGAATEVSGVPQTGAAYNIYRTVGGATVYYTVTAAQWRAGFTDTGATTFTGTAVTSVPRTTEGAAKRPIIGDQALRTLSPTTIVGLRALVTGAAVHESEKNYTRQLDRMLAKIGTEMYTNYPTNTTLVLTATEIGNAAAAAAGAQFSTLKADIQEEASTSANVPLTQDAGEQAMI